MKQIMQFLKSRHLGILLILLAAIAAMTTGCSSSSSESSLETIQEGVMVDGIVKGIGYRTETLSGITDSKGKFKYREGEEVEFFVGGIVFGKAKAKKIMTPLDLVEEAEDASHPTVLNIARFMLTIDDDGNPDNGITISEQIRTTAANMSVNFAVTTIEFEEDENVLQVVASLTTVSIIGPRSLITLSIVQIHLTANLARLDEFSDDDNDGLSEDEGDCDDSNSDILQCDADNDGVAAGEDCDDEDPSIFPGAEEICGDGIDQDCDGTDLVCQEPPVDPADTDDDNDSFTENQGDCDDANAAVFPGAEEICGDGIDQDCDGTDLVCPEPPVDPADTDGDNDSFTENQGDCDDKDASIYPGAEEICGDGIDQDCDGSDLVCEDEDTDTDEDADKDADNDGVKADEDCNDNDASVYPGAVEICGDGIDQDCDGADLVCPEEPVNPGTDPVDPVDPVDPADTDDDNDGFTENQGDCDDTNAAINPEAEEICGDGIDQDCDGKDLDCDDADQDGDKYSVNQGDCDDTNAAINPGAEEICGDGIDQDCDGKDLDCDDADQDGDKYSVNQGDCDDEDASVYPGATEICGDGIDQDCDGEDLVCTEEGTFIYGQSGVEGIQYESRSLSDETVVSGVTDSGGQFEYISGGKVKFFIGRIILGTIVPKTLVTPIDLVEGAEDETNETVLNICSLLSTLDDDDDPENGVEISDSVRIQAKTAVDFKVTSEVFEKEFADIISALTVFRYKGPRMMVFNFKVKIIIKNTIENKNNYAKDEDEDGFTVGDGDCDDKDASINPDAEEICGDGIDQDCNGEDLICEEDLDKDEDNDGFTIGDGDCDDSDNSIYPGAEEICGDGIDQDCDGEDDECPIDIAQGTWQCPAEGDTGFSFIVLDEYVSSLSAVLNYEGDNACIGTAAVSSGNAQFEIVENKFTYTADNFEITGKFTSASTCRLTWYYKGDDCEKTAAGNGDCEAVFVEEEVKTDADEDGYTQDIDCDDEDAAVYPGAEEICGNEIDENCDGVIEECVEENDDIKTGVFIFGFISGLEYKTETLSGVTIDGVFEYLEGENITFYIGNIILGTVLAKPEIAPTDLDPDAENPLNINISVINICRFMLTLDDDNDLDNGIEIGDKVKAKAYSTEVSVDFTLVENEFETSVIDLISILTSARGCDCGPRVLSLTIRVQTLILDLLEKFKDEDNDGYSKFMGDCDDTNPDVNPGSEEICANEIDENCNGVADENCAADDKKTLTLDNGIKITFKEVVYEPDGTSKWTYSVEETEGSQDMVSWGLDLPDCVSVIAVEPEIGDTEESAEDTMPEETPEEAVEGRIAEVSPVKWEVESDFENGEFTIILDKRWSLALVNVTAQGTDTANGEIAGPGCEEVPAEYEDKDNDGFNFYLDGECPEGIVCDCNDDDEKINPDAQDDCELEQGRDLNCDGEISCTADTVTAGKWSGITDQNTGAEDDKHVISFNVMDNQVSSLSILMDYVGEFDANCVVSNKLFLGSAAIDIIDGKFAFSASHVEVLGEFITLEDGTMKCEGTWFYKNAVCSGTGSGTWEAVVSDVNADKDGDGFTKDQGDCNDEDAAVYPGASEICGDGIIQDCTREADLVCIDDEENVGKLSIMLTSRNAKEEDLKAAYITVKAIKVKGDKSNKNKDKWQTFVLADVQTLALFDFESETSDVLTIELPAGLEGKFKELSLILSKELDSEEYPFANYVVDADGNAHEMELYKKIEKDGIKIKKPKFIIGKGETTALKFEFDIRKAIKIKKIKNSDDYKYQLKSHVKGSFFDITELSDISADIPEGEEEIVDETEEAAPDEIQVP